MRHSDGSVHAGPRTQSYSMMPAICLMPSHEILDCRNCAMRLHDRCMRRVALTRQQRVADGPVLPPHVLHDQDACRVRRRRHRLVHVLRHLPLQQHRANGAVPTCCQQPSQSLRIRPSGHQAMKY